MKNHIEFCRVKYDDREECFPLVYHIQYLEERRSQMQKALIIYGRDELLIASYDELGEEVFLFHTQLRRALWWLDWSAFITSATASTILREPDFTK